MKPLYKPTKPNNMEKTLEELIENYTFYDRSDFSQKEPLLDKADVLQLLQQVREATGNEFLKAMEGVDLPIVTTMKIMVIMATTDRIKITE